MTEIILLINTIIINIYLFYFVQTQIEKSMELLIQLIFNANNLYIVNKTSVHNISSLMAVLFLFNVFICCLFLSIQLDIYLKIHYNIIIAWEE